MAMGIFVCPALCGCQLIIDGRWVHDPDPNERIDGLPVYHGFPARLVGTGKTSIRSLEIRQCCLTHAPWQTEPLPANPYGGAPGYLDVPTNPTPAERLFIRMFDMCGGVHTLDTCGCSIGFYALRSDLKVLHYVEHPQYHRACARHAHLRGADRHAVPMAEHRKKNEALK